MKPFIEFIETTYSDGSTRLALQSPELPTARDGRPYRFDILLGLRAYSSGVRCRSRANGDGSIRWRTYRTLEEAMQAGRKWATRKIMEARREDRKRQSIFQTQLAQTISQA